MRNLPFVQSIRFNNWIRYRDTEEKKRLKRIKNAIEAYIYIYGNKFFIPQKIHVERNNDEYIDGLKWELQGLESTIDNYTKRIKFFFEWYKPTTLG